MRKSKKQLEGKNITIEAEKEKAKSSEKSKTTVPRQYEP